MRDVALKPEEPLDLLPDREDEDDAQHEERDDDEPESEPGEPLGTLPLDPVPALRALDAVRALNRVRIDRRRLLRRARPWGRLRHARSLLRWGGCPTGVAVRDT